MHNDCVTNNIVQYLYHSKQQPQLMQIWQCVHAHVAVVHIHGIMCLCSVTLMNPEVDPDKRRASMYYSTSAQSAGQRKRKREDRHTGHSNVPSDGSDTVNGVLSKVSQEAFSKRADLGCEFHASNSRPLGMGRGPPTPGSFRWQRLNKELHR